MIVERIFALEKSVWAMENAVLSKKEKYSFMDHQFTGVFTKSRIWTEMRPNCEWQANTQLDSWSLSLYS